MQECNIPGEEYDFGELRRGRRYKRQKIGAGREEQHSEPKEREPCALVRIIEISYIGGEEEGFQSSPVIEEPVSPTQTGSYVESTTSCASPKSEITFEDLSKAIIVSQGMQSSSSQNSGSSAQSQSLN
jgi:hypothetical protein